jgi:type II secretory pathway component GspD/PulD (secretin)
METIKKGVINNNVLAIYSNFHKIWTSQTCAKIMKFSPLLSTAPLTSLLLALVLPLYAQIGVPDAGPLRKLPPALEATANELRNAAPQQYDFSKSNLGDVLRFLATDARISFISLPDDSAEGSRVITFSINASPFSVLETLCKANGLTLLPEENGMWFIRPADDRELNGKSYAVRNNAMEKVENSTETASAGGGGTIQSASVDLQGARENFKVKRSELVNDIRSILDLPPEKENGEIPAALTVLDPSAAAAHTNSNELSAMHQPKVIWKSDSNTLYVVATRLQHLWVEGYLAAADKEQPVIAIEVKFIETSKDPSKELGIDWSGTLGGNGTFRQSRTQSIDPKTGIITLQQDLMPNTNGGFRADAGFLDTMADLGKLGATGWPSSAVLGGMDLSVRLRALLNDQDTTLTSYPRMVTLNNREVVIRSVVNQPVLDGSSAIGGGGSAAISQSITYLPIGTVLNILPKKMANDRLLLNIKVTISSIIGEKIISGNPYPVATSRVYNAPVEVNDGYTVAIGGLDEAKEKETQVGVPVLGKIPLIGWAFKSRSREKNHKNLMLFITPRIVDPRDGGLPPEPESVLPSNPGRMVAKKPIVDNAGNLKGGPDSVPGSISYLQRECDLIQQIIKESRSTPAESKKLTEMKIALNKLDEQVATMSVAHPEKADILTQAQIDLNALHQRVSAMKMQVMKKEYY